MYANPLSEIYIFSERLYEGKTIRCAPDLAIEAPWNPLQIICIEYERHQKKTTRYDDKWTAYEYDPNVSRVLYVVPNQILLDRLSRHVTEHFFRRTLGEAEFSIGFVTYDDLMSKGRDAKARCHFVGETYEIEVHHVLHQAEIDDGPLTRF